MAELIGIEHPVGLVGFFGHTYVEAPDAPGQRTVQYQFRIIRPLPPDSYVVQLFSFMNGSPTELAVYTEAFLWSDDVKLYPDQESWHAALEKHDRAGRWLTVLFELTLEKQKASGLKLRRPS